jgi:hypothetical protein
LFSSMFSRAIAAVIILVIDAAGRACSGFLDNSVLPVSKSTAIYAGELIAFFAFIFAKSIFKSESSVLRDSINAAGLSAP